MMADYNSDFTDMVDNIMFSVRAHLRTLGWSHFTNGYYNQRNDIYFNGFKLNGIDFPVVIGVTANAPWIMSYNNRLVFTNDFRFKLIVMTELFEKQKLENFQAEDLEFNSIDSIEIIIKPKQSFGKDKKILKSDEQTFMKEFKAIFPTFQSKIDAAIELQVSRRFDEVMVANEKVAMKYCPKTITDIFVF